MAVGIICEYNPFHYGHIYHIEKVKEMFPKEPIILVLSGYFTERGEVSVISKEKKTKLALFYGVDLVLELPFVFATQSADTFAQAAIMILHHFQVSDIVFGSETNDVSLLYQLAQEQTNSTYEEKVKALLKKGENYPTALSKALSIPIQEPNDLLGISYIKAILKNNFKIKAHTILRTCDYHGTTQKNQFLGAKAIREKKKGNEDISSFVPKEVLSYYQNISMEDFFPYLKYRILSETFLNRFFAVDEGIEKRIYKAALKANSYQELIGLVKTKRYTITRLQRMFLAILIGLSKEEHQRLKLDYVRILGLSKKGREYLKQLELSIPTKVSYESLEYIYEQRAALLYSLISKTDVLLFETRNTPILD